MTKEELFDINQLKAVYEGQVFTKNSKGVDKIHPKHLAKNLEYVLEITSRKCQSGKYKFTPYLEMLKLKSRDKTPRLLAIPSARDRIVLQSLKNFLHNTFDECVNRVPPNVYVRQVNSFIKKIDNPSFIKLDLTNFYGSLNHDLTLSKIEKKVECKVLQELIISAIKNPTIPKNSRKNIAKKYINRKGVPQGLPISNILADIYFYDIDKQFTTSDYLYLRYVDDIILIGQKDIIGLAYEQLEKEITLAELSLNKEKCALGLISNGVDYLGYYIKNSTISVRPSSIDKHIHRISAKFAWLKNILLKPEAMPTWMKSDKAILLKRFIEELNEVITGAIYLRKRYGWLFYFSQLNDMKLLFELDNIIGKFFSKLDIFHFKKPAEIKSYVKTFSEIRKNGGVDYVMNYDELNSRDKRTAYLKEMGVLKDGETYSTEYIDSMFERIVRRRVSQLEVDVSSFS